VGDALKSVLAAGCIWGLYNAAVGMVFGFGTALLTERGWSLTAAGSATSLVLWSAVVCVPLGGFLSDRLGKPREVMLGGFALSALLLFICARTENVVFWFVLLGVVASLPPGAIMSLPLRVLPPQARAIGMGLYFTMFYVCIVAAPIIAGQLAVVTGTSQAAFDLGIAMLFACFGLLLLYERFAARFTTHV
jgi:MFS family permease